MTLAQDSAVRCQVTQYNSLGKPGFISAAVLFSHCKWTTWQHLQLRSFALKTVKTQLSSDPSPASLNWGADLSKPQKICCWICPCFSKWYWEHCLNVESQKDGFIGCSIFACETFPSLTTANVPVVSACGKVSDEGAGSRRLAECRATRTSTLRAPAVPNCPEQPLPVSESRVFL